MALTALAGPAANLILAYLGMVIWKVMYYWAPINDATLFAAYFLEYLVYMNVSLAMFNLLPVPPLDGSRVALLLLPRNLYFRVMRYERVILVILLAMVWFGVFNQPLAWLNDSMWQLMGKATGYIDQLAYSIYYSQFVSGV